LSPAERLDPGLRRGDEQGTWLVWRNGAVAAIACTAAGAAGVALHLAVASLASTPVDSAAIRPLPPAAPPPCVVGSLPGAWGVGLPFGATDATTLHALADLAERYGDGALRLTPWRAFIVRGGALPEAAAALGLIVDPADPRLALAACAGRPGCASAHADTRADAARLAALLPGLRAHLSGCTKGCAHPGPAPVTLVACPDGYALVRDGAASDTPEHTGLTLDAAAALVRRAPEPALP
jgi:precorrin-3B synthase